MRYSFNILVNFQGWPAVAMAVAASCMLSSCAPYGAGEWQSMQTGNYGSSRIAEPWYDSPPRYNYRGGRAVCSRCNFNPCRCSSGYGARYGHLNRGYGHGAFGRSGYRSHDSHRDHDNHRGDHRDHKKSSSNKKKLSSKDEKYKLTGRNVGRGHPKKYHTLDWYKDRGYNVKKFTLKNKDGKSYKSSSSSKKKSSSSSKKRSSSSKKKKSSSKGKSKKSKKANNRA